MDRLASVKIVSLVEEGKGELTLDGETVAAEETVSREQLAARLLLYQPEENGNGRDYASFNFKVSDGTNESEEDTP